MTRLAQPPPPVGSAPEQQGAAPPAQTQFRRVVVVGLGYVGLPTALMLARAGVDVVGCDIDAGRVAALDQGSVAHINEPEIHALVDDPDVRQHLRAQLVPAEADAFILAVPTPVDPRRKQADLGSLTAAARSIVPHLRKGNLVIVESTVPPLTCRQVIVPLIEAAGFSASGAAPDIFVAHCPERVLPGNVVHELAHNDRIIGGITPGAAHTAMELYRSFVSGQIYLTDDITAELCKLMENTYRDVNIALANELAAVAENLGVDPHEAIRLANCHPRVRILSPGIGVGGHCIPVDPWFIKEVDAANSRLITVARAVNDGMPARTAARIRRVLASQRDARIVAIGATFKPNTYDLRGSPAVEVVRLLEEDGYDISLYDPLTKEYPCTSVRSVCAGADCLVILVPHDVVERELREHEQEILQSMRQPLIVRF